MCIHLYISISLHLHATPSAPAGLTGPAGEQTHCRNQCTLDWLLCEIYTRTYLSCIYLHICLEWQLGMVECLRWTVEPQLCRTSSSDALQRTSVPMGRHLNLFGCRPAAAGCCRVLLGAAGCCWARSPYQRESPAERNAPSLRAFQTHPYHCLQHYMEPVSPDTHTSPTASWEVSL